MRHLWVRRAGRWLAILLLIVVSALMVGALIASPARADGDTVALSIANGTSFTYGGTEPSFTAVVTLGAKPTANYFYYVSVQLDASGQKFLNVNPPSSSADGMTLTFTGLTPSNPIAAGSHTAVARFTNPETSITSVSPLVSFTVNKATADFICAIDGNTMRFVGVDQTLNFHMTSSSGGQVPAEWQSGTYTITFDGPTRTIYSNRASDSNNIVTVPAPPQPGLYTLTCTFNGSTSYTSSTFTDNFRYTVSAMHSLGSVQLFTNPTTVVAGRSMDFYIVFHPASGVPRPTGEFSIYMGNYYTNSIKLSATGANLVHLSPISSMVGVNNIQIKYFGDINYNQAITRFPLTNPPIPSGNTSGGSGSGSSGNTSQGTATAGTASATTTPGGDAPTATAIGAGAVQSPQSPATSDSNGTLLVILLALLGVAVLGAGVGVAIYLVRRARYTPGVGSQGADGFAAPGQPTSSHDETWPFTRGDY